MRTVLYIHLIASGTKATEGYISYSKTHKCTEKLCFVVVVFFKLLNDLFILHLSYETFCNTETSISSCAHINEHKN